MNFEPTVLPEVIRIIPKVHEDPRGFFMETWHARRFADGGIDARFLQENASYSVKGVLRGLHYQIEQPQGKLVRVIRGEVFDVAVDLRRSSPRFGQWVGVTLSGDNKHQLWIPPGFGHGFLVVSETAQFEYKCTDYYAPEFERSIQWDDPDIGIDWPLAEGNRPILSTKDTMAPLLNAAETYS